MPKGQPEIPDGLIRLLQDFTVAILRNKPQHIPSFAINYFTEITDKESRPTVSIKKNVIVVQENSESEELDDDVAEKMSSMAASSNYTARRASVAAEPYNPEEDEEAQDENDLERKHSFHEKSPEQISRLMEVCRGIVLFSELDDNEVLEVINAMFMRVAVPGDDIIEQMDSGDNFYVIDSGKFEAKIDDREGGQRVVKEYDGFGFFGELALMYNAPRSATVTAVTEGILWALSRQSFRRLVLGRAAKRRREFMELLHSVRILQDLSPYQRMSLADNLQRRSLPQGGTIIREGDPGEEIFFVMEGVARVSKDDNGTEHELTKIEKGGYFGELALLSSKPRAASVFAETDIVLAVLGVESFERLLGPCINLMQRKASVYRNFSEGT